MLKTFHPNEELSQNNKFTLLDKVVCIYLFADIFLLPSDLLGHFGGKFMTYGARALFLGIVFCIIAPKKGFTIKWYLISAFLFTVLCGVIACLGLVDFSPVKKTLIVMFSLLVLFFCSKKHIESVVKMATPLFVILLIGAFIGFVYAFAGGQPIFSFPNPDGRMNYVFLTTCTNTRIGNIIRPSGIYDEPGSFSFFLCILAVFRVFTGKNDMLTYFMLLIGNITFSAIHAIFFVFYNFYMLGKYYKKKIFCVYIAAVVFVMSLMLYQYYDVFDKMLFLRLHGENLTENNRSRQIEGSLRILKNTESLIEVILFGEPHVESKEGFLYVNPLGPLVYEGLLVSWIYYACMFILIFGGSNFRKKHRFILWAIALVYAQRPYYALFGASTSLYLITAIFALNEIKEMFPKIVFNKNLIFPLNRINKEGANA